MSLRKMTKEEIELLSYTDIAKLYLEENKKTLNTAELFKEICNLLEVFGVEISGKQNLVKGEEVEISTPNSKVKVFVIPTDEEIMIARDTMALISE